MAIPLGDYGIYNGEMERGGDEGWEMDAQAELAAVEWTVVE